MTGERFGFSQVVFGMELQAQKLLLQGFMVEVTYFWSDKPKISIRGEAVEPLILLTLSGHPSDPQRTSMF
jgi:hypothetical protein